MRRRDLLLGLAAAACLPRAAAAKSFAGNAQVERYIEYLHTEHGFLREELQLFFSQLAHDERVLRLIGAPAADGAAPPKPVKKTYWRQYRKQRLTPKKIAAGLRFHQQHQAPLQAAAAAYGVPSAVITAIIGIETAYGKHTGAYAVARTLATLGFSHPKRGEEFLAELTEFLLYARESRVDPMSIAGSYAGAIGIAQFMPSSLRKFAVDASGDSRVNLFREDDAIHSIANFLKMHGWRADIAGITYPAAIDAAAAETLIRDTGANEYKAVMTLADLRGYGVQTAAPDGVYYVFVDLENRYNTEYRVGTENFYALTRYNKSFKYAAVVTDLAAAIGEKV